MAFKDMSEVVGDKMAGLVGRRLVPQLHEAAERIVAGEFDFRVSASPSEVLDRILAALPVGPKPDWIRGYFLVSRTDDALVLGVGSSVNVPVEVVVETVAADEGVCGRVRVQRWMRSDDSGLIRGADAMVELIRHLSSAVTNLGGEWSDPWIAGLPETRPDATPLDRARGVAETVVRVTGLAPDRLARFCLMGGAALLLIGIYQISVERAWGVGLALLALACVMAVVSDQAAKVARTHVLPAPAANPSGGERNSPDSA